MEAKEIRENLGALPVQVKVTIGIASVVIIGILAALIGDYRIEHKAATERAALPGKCFDLPPMKEAKIQRFVPFERSDLLEVVQTDQAGNQSVTYVPERATTGRLTPCAPTS